MLHLQANILFAKELARQLKEEGSPILAFSLHPGGLMWAAGVLRFAKQAKSRQGAPSLAFALHQGAWACLAPSQMPTSSLRCTSVRGLQLFCLALGVASFCMH